MKNMEELDDRIEEELITLRLDENDDGIYFLRWLRRCVPRVKYILATFGRVHQLLSLSKILFGS